MSDAGIWTEVAADPAEASPASDAFAAFGTASWLPTRVQRAQMAEAQAEAREARRADRERQDRADKLAESALVAYRNAAEVRGEYVSALDLATGNVPGRTVADIFAGARAAAEREDAIAAARQRRQDGSGEWIGAAEPRIGRSDGWPQSAYLADRMITQASDLHRARIAYETRHGYRSAAGEMAERAAQRQAEQAESARYRAQQGYTYGEITR